MNIKMNRLQSRLGHVFQDQELLTRALTHRSAGSVTMSDWNFWVTPF